MGGRRRRKNHRPDNGVQYQNYQQEEKDLQRQVRTDRTPTTHLANKKDSPIKASTKPFSDDSSIRHVPPSKSITRATSSNLHDSSAQDRSKNFKQFLLRTLDETKRQIDLWCPDVQAGEDMMDWEPEQEIIIPPQEGSILYSEARDARRRLENGSTWNRWRDDKYQYQDSSSFAPAYASSKGFVPSLSTVFIERGQSPAHVNRPWRRTSDHNLIC